MTTIGFTGTQEGMTDAQKLALPDGTVVRFSSRHTVI